MDRDVECYAKWSDDSMNYGMLMMPLCVDAYQRFDFGGTI